jgi:hypothetical protein
MRPGAANGNSSAPFSCPLLSRDLRLFAAGLGGEDRFGQEMRNELL